LTDKVEALHRLLKATQTKLQAAEHAAQGWDEEVKGLRALLTKHEIPLPPRGSFSSYGGDSTRQLGYARLDWGTRSGGAGAVGAVAGGSKNGSSNVNKNIVNVGVTMAKSMSPGGNRSQDIRLRNSLVLKLQQRRTDLGSSSSAWPANLKVPPHVQPVMRYAQPGLGGKLPVNSPVRAAAHQQHRVSGSTSGSDRDSPAFRPQLRTEVDGAGASTGPPGLKVPGARLSPRKGGKLSPRNTGKLSPRNTGKLSPKLSPRKNFSATGDHNLLMAAKQHMKSPVLSRGQASAQSGRKR
jgi:hypothetical protein